MKKALSIVGVVALIAVMAVCLVACAPKDLDAAKAKMEDAGYIVATQKASTIDGTLEELGLEKGCIVGAIEATKVSLTDPQTVSAILFDSNKNAKAYMEKAEESGALDAMKAFLGDSVAMKQSGKWVVSGTKDAVDAFLK